MPSRRLSLSEAWSCEPLISIWGNLPIALLWSSSQHAHNASVQLAETPHVRSLPKIGRRNTKRPVHCTGRPLCSIAAEVYQLGRDRRPGVGEE